MLEARHVLGREGELPGRTALRRVFQKHPDRLVDQVARRPARYIYTAGVAERRGQRRTVIEVGLIDHLMEGNCLANGVSVTMVKSYPQG